LADHLADHLLVD